MSDSLTIGVVALVLGIFGTGYAICIGRKPLKDYFIELYNNMWWNNCFGTKRINWMKSYVEQNHVSVIFHDEELKQLNAKTRVIIGKILLSSDFNSLQDIHFETLIKTILQTRIDELFYVEFVCLKIMQMSLNSSSVAWDLIKVMLDKRDKNDKCDVNSPTLWNAYQRLEGLLVEMVVDIPNYEPNFIKVCELLVILRTFLPDRARFPSNLYNRTCQQELRRLLDESEWSQLFPLDAMN